MVMIILYKGPCYPHNIKNDDDRTIDRMVFKSFFHLLVAAKKSPM